MRVTSNLTLEGLQPVDIQAMRDHSGDAVTAKKLTDQFFSLALHASPPTYDNLHRLQRVSKLMAQNMRITAYSTMKEIHAKK